MELFIGILFIAFAIIVGILANNRGREGVAWGFISLFISPLIAGIILAVLPNLKEKEEKRKEKDRRIIKRIKEEEREEKKKRELASGDFILSIESLKQLYDKKMLSELEYKTKKDILINSLSSKILVEGKDNFLAGLIPLIDEGTFNEDDIQAVKNTISY